MNISNSNEQAKQAVSKLLLEFLDQHPKIKVAQLARQVKLDRTTMSRIVHGHLVPSPPTCQALAMLMAIPEEQLLKLAGYLTANDNIKDDLILSDPELALQFYQIGSLSLQDKEKIKTLLRKEIQKATTNGAGKISQSRPRPSFARPLLESSLVSSTPEAEPKTFDIPTTPALALSQAQIQIKG